MPPHPGLLCTAPRGWVPGRWVQTPRGRAHAFYPLISHPSATSADYVVKFTCWRFLFLQNSIMSQHEKMLLKRSLYSEERSWPWSWTFVRIRTLDAQLEHVPSPVWGSGSSPVCGGGAYLSCVVSVKILWLYEKQVGQLPSTGGHQLTVVTSSWLEMFSKKRETTYIY